MPITFNWAEFPHREIEVPEWGTFLVPRYIVRVDIETVGKTKTHGWQVRYSKAEDGDKKSKFFSDANRTPISSLVDARSYLGKIWKDEPQRKRRESKSKKNPVGMTGVFLTYQKKGKSLEIYVEVQYPGNTKPPRRIYVGTENTASPEKVLKALGDGKELRLIWEIESERIARDF